MVDYEKHDARRLEEGIAHSPTQSDYTCSTLRADTFKSEEPKTEQLPAETGQTQDADCSKGSLRERLSSLWPQRKQLPETRIRSCSWAP